MQSSNFISFLAPAPVFCFVVRARHATNAMQFTHTPMLWTHCFNCATRTNNATIVLIILLQSKPGYDIMQLLDGIGSRPETESRP